MSVAGQVLVVAGLFGVVFFGLMIVIAVAVLGDANDRSERRDPDGRVAR